MLIINFCIMFNLALTTLPLYSLAVLLGSEIKDTHVRHEPLAERLHKIFMRHSSEQVSIGVTLHAIHERIVQLRPLSLAVCAAC